MTNPLDTITGCLAAIDQAVDDIRAALGTAAAPPATTPTDPPPPPPPVDSPPANQPPVTPPPVTQPPTNAGDEPTPQASDRILLDGRRVTQSANTLGEAWPAAKLGTAQLGSAAMYEYMQGEGKWNLSTDIDGSGTHALRIDWPKYKGSAASDSSATLVTYLAKPYPTHICLSWKHRMGRTPSGGGIGLVDGFEITNGLFGNASRKMLLLLRDRADLGGQGRIDYIWPGPAPVRPAFTLDVPGAATTRYDAIAFNPQDHVGQILTTTMEIRVASSDTAKDGILRLWLNGTKVIEAMNVPMGAGAIERFQFPATFNSPAQDQSEYFWDHLVWAPGA